MRYEQVANLVRLAVRLQGTLGGLTLDDIEAAFSVTDGAGAAATRAS